MESLRLNVKGMTCDHCTRAVKNALIDLEGVDQVSVDLDSGLAEVSGDSLDLGKITAAIEEEGYSATLWEE